MLNFVLISVYGQSPKVPKKDKTTTTTTVRDSASVKYYNGNYILSFLTF